MADEITLAMWAAITLETGVQWGELDRWMTAALEEGLRLADHAAAGLAALALGSLRCSEGRFADAGRYLAEAELQFEHHDAIGMLAITSSMQVGVACFTGDTAGAAVAMERCRAALGDGEPFPNQLSYVMRA